MTMLSICVAVPSCHVDHLPVRIESANHDAAGLAQSALLHERGHVFAGREAGAAQND
jgi:hypothetical protein